MSSDRDTLQTLSFSWRLKKNIAMRVKSTDVGNADYSHIILCIDLIDASVEPAIDSINCMYQTDIFDEKRGGPLLLIFVRRKRIVELSLKQWTVVSISRMSWWKGVRHYNSQFRYTTTANQEYLMEKFKERIYTSVVHGFGDITSWFASIQELCWDRGMGHGT